MAKELIHSFKIKLASINKPKKQYSGTVISRKCIAIVIKIDGILKAKINTSPVEESDNFIVIDFTDKSLELKGKTYVFLKQKDKYNHFVCIIRDINKANLFPGLPCQYDVLHEGLVISGHIIRKDGKMYFNYEDLLSFKEGSQFMEDVRIKEDKPLFNNEY